MTTLQKMALHWNSLPSQRGTFLMLALRWRLWVSAEEDVKEGKAFTTLSGMTVLILCMMVAIRKSDVASQFTAPSESSSHYDSTTHVIDDKVLISSLQLRCLCV